MLATMGVEDAIGVLGSKDHGQEWPCYQIKENHLAEKKIIAVLGAPGAQGGGLSRTRDCA